MSFLNDLQNKADCFSEYDAATKSKSPETSRTPTAHNVPISTDEKGIQSETVPYFMRVLHKNVMKNTGQILLPEEYPQSRKEQKRKMEDEDNDLPSTSRRGF